ncbi:MAG: lysophospholipid acyltransferase family protein [Thiogranum sp.]|nr:lysophospholipid acyltransferase family protein [Thiogranum sp.]
MARLLFAKTATRIPLLGKLGWWLEAGVLKLFWHWSSTFGGERAYEKGYRLFSRLGPRMKKHRHVLGNLQIAFPELSQEQRQALAIRVWGNLGGVLAEYPRLHKLVDTGPESHTDIRVSAASKPVVENRQPAVYVTPHLGNWEIAAAAVARLEIPITTIYSPQSNPLIDRMVQSIREALGLRFVAKENALRHLVTELRNGRSVGMLPDQRIDEGEPVPYFGVDAPTTTSPAWLAIKMNCPLIPVEIERMGQNRFRAVFHDPIDTRADIAHVRNRAIEVTRQVNACFEQWIRKHPEHWHCAKRRWPVEAYETQRPGQTEFRAGPDSSWTSCVRD